MNDSPGNEFDETIAASFSGDPLPVPLTVRTEEEISLDRPYTPGDTIGQGGMGAVISAEDLVLERTVALKVLLSEKADSGHARFRFEREARILARLEHPNIVPIHEAGTTEDGRPYYTMKRIKGRDLQSILNSLRSQDPEVIDRFDLNELLNVFRKICDGVAFAHHVGMIHRDLKPANIMIGEYGEVLVMDWGLARILDEDLKEQLREAENAPIPPNAPLSESRPEDTLHGQVMGTPHYMAPEQATGNTDDVGIASDIYALGGILHAMLTLRPPHGGDSCEEILERIQSGERERISPEEMVKAPHCLGPEIPYALVAVTEKAMDTEPDRRYSSVDLLAQDIAAFRSGFATSAEKATPIRRALLFSRRHRKTTLALLTGILLVLAVYGFSYYQLRSERKYFEERIEYFRNIEAEYLQLQEESTNPGSD